MQHGDWLRYQELRAAGPVLTAEDVERLQKFLPKKSRIHLAVLGAFR